MKKLLLIMLAAIPLLMQSGNIPQYTAAKGTNKYAVFTDGTAIACTWLTGDHAVFPDGEAFEARSAEGFPIGFDFRMGGQVFNQFVIDDSGDVYLGRDVVNYRGDAFRIVMSLIKSSLKSGAFRYRTTGTAGNHVLSIQLSNAIVNEGATAYCGKYSVQIRLYEADGRIEIALSELDTVNNVGFGFGCGLFGWDADDVILVTATGLDNDLSVSPFKKVDMLEPKSYIKWNQLDFDKFYKPVYVFTPVGADAPAASAPTDLTVSQSGDDLLIACNRAADAAATVVLISEQPFTPADYPADGATFLPGTKFGNATALYYGNDAHVSLSVPAMESGHTYYVSAVSANGYPAFATGNALTATVTTSHAAPSSLTATATSGTSASLAWQADFPVIIAATDTPVEGYQKGYCGRFGIPAADAKPGDTLAGGGTVVYAGSASQCTVDCDANQLTFFRAWTVDGTKVSATAADAWCVPVPTLPFAPAVEFYPMGEKIEGWTAADEQYLPWHREGADDYAVRAVSVVGAVETLLTPALALNGPVKVTFDYAVETVRPPLAVGPATIPQGNRPGDFGEEGYLSVSIDGVTYKSINSYAGTMRAVEEGYATGSSTFEAFEVEIPAVGADAPIAINFKTDETSYLYIRNIRVEQIDHAPAAPALAPTDAAATEDRYANLHFTCRKAEDADNTIVLFSESPITADCYPADGVVPAVGSKLDNSEVTVLYYGPDETVDVTTDYETVVADFETPYYFVALSASANPLYNRDNVAAVTYVTRGEMAAPALGQVTVSGGTLTVKATRHQHAETTLLLLSEGDFNGELVDGRNYNVGDVIGNATVIYHGNDADINHSVNLTARSVNYTVTAASGNSLWWHEDYATANVSVDTTTGVEEINAADLAKDAVIHTLAGIRVHGILAPGIYIVNGVKTLVK